MTMSNYQETRPCSDELAGFARAEEQEPARSQLLSPPAAVSSSETSEERQAMLPCHLCILTFMDSYYVSTTSNCREYLLLIVDNCLTLTRILIKDAD